MDYANVEINKNGNWGMVHTNSYLLGVLLIWGFLDITSVKELNDLKITHKVL